MRAKTAFALAVRHTAEEGAAKHKKDITVEMAANFKALQARPPRVYHSSPDTTSATAPVEYR